MAGEVLEADSGMAKTSRTGLSTEEKQQLQGYGDELQGKLIEESGDAAKFILSLNLDR